MGQRKAIIIGSGMGGLGSAGLLAKAGWDVTVLEKNSQVGGRAFTFTSDGFTFDGGPSWLLMLDVFEHFFELLGEDIHKHLKLKKLSPGFRIFYKDTFLKADINSDPSTDSKTFEQLEGGASAAAARFLDRTAYLYKTAEDRFMYKNYDSVRDFLTREMITQGSRMNVFSPMSQHVHKYFKTDAMRKTMLFPAMFLGSSPYNTPGLFNLIDHAVFTQGVYYPDGGMYRLVEALQSIAEKYGAKFRLNSAVQKIIVKNGIATGVLLENGNELKADIIISNADMHHTETELLDKNHRTKSERYWKSRTMAPSALLMYLGVKGKVPELIHHNLLFSKDWKQNFKDLFDRPRWPKDPSFYIGKPSETDPSVAPKNHENLFVLVPIAADLSYDQRFLDHFANKILETIEKSMYVKDLRERIVYKKLFCVKDFGSQFNSYKGSALGLAHTLRQTAIGRPNNRNPKVKDFYYVGAGTNPGIGLPATLISAELMYKRLINDTSPNPLTTDKLA
jgi:phytoene desaturase